MIFSLVSKRTTMGASPPMPLVPKNNYIMSNSARPKPARPVKTPQPYVATSVSSDATKKSMKWGEPVWFFLHTMAHKIKPESFAILRNDLLKHIYTICTNLPCPDCSVHSKTYLNGINFNNIKTKDDLKNVLFEFHNSVNIRKGFVLFEKEQLDSKYDSANFGLIINYFLSVFLDKHASPRMISDDIYRSRLTYQIRDWLITNKSHFNS